MGALLVLGIGCTITAWLLRGSASYALTSGPPRDLGVLSSAELEAGGVRGLWVRGVAELEPDAISFQRQGEQGSLLLGRVAERSDLWVLLPVPAGTQAYFPPRVLEGRLLARSAMGLPFRPVLQLMDARGSRKSDHLLLVGKTPRAHRTDFALLIVLSALGLLASTRFALLALPARHSSRRS